MSSSPTMQDLFAAAREDAPPDLVRDQVWGRVAAATAVPAGAAATAKALATPAGGKLVAVGALIGAAGVTAAALAIGAMNEGVPQTNGAPRRTPSVVVSGPTAGARLAEAAPRGRMPVQEHEVAIVSGSTAPLAAQIERGADDDASALAEEARLVTEARAALVRGEPERALDLARRTHHLAARVLEPEELALEARALRALGRTDEALATELTLRRRFPSHALSR